MIKRKDNIIYISYIIIILISSIPIFCPFLIRGHDIYFHLMRIEGLAEGLKSGQFPVKIQPVWYGGFGYAVSVFYGDLFIYPVAILRLFGVSLQNSYKCYLVLCNIMTILISGYSFKGIFRNSYIGVFGSALYSLSVYRLVNLYTRGALGEYTGMAFLPLIVYACVLLLDKEGKKETLKKGSTLLGAGMAFILQSHILTAELTCLMLCGVALLYIRRLLRLEVIINVLRAVAIALSLSLWFIVPLADYMLSGRCNISITRDDELMIQGLGIFISQIFPLFDNAVGESFDMSFGPQGDFAQGVGMGLFLALPVFFALMIGYKRRFKAFENKIAVTAALFSILAITLSTLYFPWNFLSRLNGIFRYIIVKIQFPWRFTGIAAVCLTLLWCAVIMFICRILGNNKGIILSAAVMCIVLVSAWHYYVDLLERGQRIVVKSSADMDSYVKSGEEYVPIGTDVNALRADALALNKDVEITDYSRQGTEIEFHYRNISDEDELIELPLLYYTGYCAAYREEGKPEYILKAEPGRNNVVSIVVKADTAGDVMLYFREPILWRAAEIISLLSFVAMLAKYIKHQKKQRGAGQ